MQLLYFFQSTDTAVALCAVLPRRVQNGSAGHRIFSATVNQIVNRGTKEYTIGLWGFCTICPARSNCMCGRGKSGPPQGRPASSNPRRVRCRLITRGPRLFPPALAKPFLRCPVSARLMNVALPPRHWSISDNLEQMSPKKDRNVPIATCFLRHCRYLPQIGRRFQRVSWPKQIHYYANPSFNFGPFWGIIIGAVRL